MLTFKNKNFEEIYNCFSFTDNQKNEFTELLEKAKMNKIPEIVRNYCFIIIIFRKKLIKKMKIPPFFYWKKLVDY